jgi:ATP-dependent RNA helicase DDX10/DBP4
MQADPQAAKTKYDRMFKRTNQNVLAPHFTDLVDQADGTGENDDADDEFITITRADHTLDESTLPESKHVSKRKLKMGVSKKAMAGLRGSGNKVVFDAETGEANHLHAVAPEGTFTEAGPADEQARRFADREKRAIAEADVQDKALAKDKRREKKRKRKARDRGEVRGRVSRWRRPL